MLSGLFNSLWVIRLIDCYPECLFQLMIFTLKWSMNRCGQILICCRICISFFSPRWKTVCPWHWWHYFKFRVEELVRSSQRCESIVPDCCRYYSSWVVLSFIILTVVFSSRVSETEVAECKKTVRIVHNAELCYPLIGVKGLCTVCHIL